MSEDRPTLGRVADAWKQHLKESGYDAPDVTEANRDELLRISRVWRRILRAARMSVDRPQRVLEFGCGGAKHLMPLYLRGWDCTGVDVSPDVIERASTFARRVAAVCNPRGELHLQCLDFKDYSCSGPRFDLVFHFGVLEHFLDDDERMGYLRKMFDAARPGGFVVSVVPSGVHPLRRLQRLHGLGGYRIPEIDYSPALLASEMDRCGAIQVRVMPHDLLGFLNLAPLPRPLSLALKAPYYLAQLPFFHALPTVLTGYLSYSLIAIGQKPAE